MLSKQIGRSRKLTLSHPCGDIKDGLNSLEESVISDSTRHLDY